MSEVEKVRNGERETIIEIDIERLKSFQNHPFKVEAEYTSIRLAELVTRESASHFDFQALCDMHYYIFQDLYDWAGKIRIINIEKSEPALGGISIEYSDCFDIEMPISASYIRNKFKKLIEDHNLLRIFT